MAAHYTLDLAPGETQSLKLRLPPGDQLRRARSGNRFDATFAQRKVEADEFYAALTPAGISADSASIMRQGYAGLLIGKQTFIYDVEPWLAEQPSRPTPGQVSSVRNSNWFHMDCADVISMPDKWEYPWFAAWDLAFHAAALASVDPEFAWDQLALMLGEHYLHPNGQIPAYEWNFSDVNPPVHAWATLFTYNASRDVLGPRAREELRVAFQKLLLNFTWWVNRKDRDGRNVFQGGFLGLDNIGVFDRSAELPTGGYLDQADGTAWMALYAQNMLQIAIELALHDPMYEEIAVKFYEHFVWIASSMDRVGDHEDEMWDEEDGFFYDVLRLPDGTRHPAKGAFACRAASPVRGNGLSRRGAHKAAQVHRTRGGVQSEASASHREHQSARQARRRRQAHAIDLERRATSSRARLPPGPEGVPERLRHPLDLPLSPRAPLRPPPGRRRVQRLLPAGSVRQQDVRRELQLAGPIWVPVNVLIIRSLLHQYSFFGDEFKVECPTGSGQQMTLFEVSREIARRLEALFARTTLGLRPVFGDVEKFQHDPHWRDHIPFHEYFHGDTGAGVGASHQTGWTAAVAALIQYFGTATPETALTGRI